MKQGEFDGRFLGVLGGMGPMAGAAFMARLTALTPAGTEQQHIPAILWSDPRVPDRPAGYMKQGADPFPWMAHGLGQLERLGAKAIAIPCNTAHLWYEELAAAAGVRLLHIVQAVIADLRRHGIDRGRIGLMGTAVTLKLGLYQQALREQGYDCITPADDELERFCTPSILHVKANRIDQAYAPAVDCARLLQDRGADAIVFGCTELPLAVPHALRAQLGVTISDSIDALALAAIDWHQSGKP
ncbi:aspartate/glutamate racemase family protein [Pollutimonas bauzanensis]|uniref:Aspartate racemase n=1 Tax=Pollutimonas bauzanensis TaxID=658167 RepID=A0A1M5Y5C5_9BURK|nr:amino acid racemase [Pollutimonas bauzanensis]SHI07257.1 aspartate racemase [Pollutimonas bauzanensis]